MKFGALTRYSLIARILRLQRAQRAGWARWTTYHLNKNVPIVYVSASMVVNREGLMVAGMDEFKSARWRWWLNALKEVELGAGLISAVDW